MKGKEIFAVGEFPDSGIHCTEGRERSRRGSTVPHKGSPRFSWEVEFQSQKLGCETGGPNERSSR